jgi:hypothetical protein
MLIIRLIRVDYSLESDRVEMIGRFRLEVEGSNDRVAVCETEQVIRTLTEDYSMVILTGLATSQSDPPYFPNRFR